MESKPFSIDFEPLKKADLLDIRLKKRFGVYAAITLVLILLSALLVHRVTQNIAGMLNVLTLFLATPLIIASIIVLLVSQKRYSKALHEFAKTNHLGAAVHTTIPDLIKDIGHSRHISNGYTIPIGNKEVSVFEYQYTVGMGKYEVTNDFTLANFQTDKKYPHIFLDAHANGLSSRYRRGQQVSLEGDFDKYFQLYAPAEADMEALAIITPDVMQTVIDSGRNYDIEINGKSVSVIASGGGYITYSELPKLLNCMAALIKEISYKDTNWQPVLQPAGKSGVLLKRNYRLMIAIAIGIIALIYIMFRFLVVRFGYNWI